MNILGCLGFAVIMAIAFSLGGWPLAVGVLVLIGWLANKFGSKETSEIQQEAKLKPLAQADDGVRDDIDTTLYLDWPAELVTACSELSAKKFHMSPNIPDAVLANARSAFPPSGDGRILAIIDSSLFGSGKTGMAVGLDGLAWKNPFVASEKISWNQLSGALIEKKGENEIKIRQSLFNFAGSEIDSDDMLRFLKVLKTYAQQRARQEKHSELPKPLTQPEAGSAARLAVTERRAGPVCVNHASLDELLELPGIGVAEAKLMIDRRAERPFLSNEELVEFLGLKPHLSKKLQDATDFVVASAGNQQQDTPVALPDAVESKARLLRGRMID